MRGKRRSKEEDEGSGRRAGDQEPEFQGRISRREREREILLSIPLTPSLSLFPFFSSSYLTRFSREDTRMRGERRREISDEEGIRVREERREEAKVAQALSLGSPISFPFAGERQTIHFRHPASVSLALSRSLPPFLRLSITHSHFSLHPSNNVARISLPLSLAIYRRKERESSSSSA